MDDAFRNIVAGRIGYDRTAINTPGDPGYELCCDNFSLIVSQELERNWWWNTQTKVFTPAAPAADSGLEAYAGVVTLDAGVAFIRRVHQNNRELRYDRQGALLLLWRYDANQDVSVEGGWLCEVERWPELFREAIVSRIASLLALNLQQRADKFTALNEWADRRLEKLVAIDSQQQTTKRIRTNRIAAARNTSYTSIHRPRG